MTTTTIRPSSTQRDGRVRSGSAVLATAQSGGGSFNTTSTIDPLIAGHQLSAGTYYLFEAFIQIDCSSITSTDTASEAIVEITFGGTTVSGAYDLELRQASPSTIIADGDWIDPTTMAAGNPLYGTIAAASITSGATVQCTLTSAGLATVQTAISGAGYFPCVMVGKGTRDGVTPSGDNRIGIRSSENATAANRPALIVTHYAAVGSRILSGRKLSTMRLVG